MLSLFFLVLKSWPEQMCKLHKQMVSGGRSVRRSAVQRSRGL